MDKNSPVKLGAYFSIVTGPRVVGRSDHKLIDIITSNSRLEPECPKIAN